ncbi:hypothetical protein PR202_ga16157 [Eleusine coracana subsp. coracana]|uniref:Uncharacterized protein n=1 Tax=Eleusine coracana subsp. coracana TaxID=191504 RepID=A0AAV5CLG6_ELECO|nr:hypothetical protein PR202_ga16157 [Eleusine coracana subsp. coracana]
MATQRRTSASFGGLCSRELGDACELFTPYAPTDPESLSPSPFRFLSSQSRVPGIKMASPPLPLPPSTTLLPRRPGRPCATKETEIPEQAATAGRFAGEVGRSYRQWLLHGARWDDPAAAAAVAAWGDVGATRGRRCDN